MPQDSPGKSAHLYSTQYGLANLKPFVCMLDKLLEEHHPQELIIFLREIRFALLDGSGHPLIQDHHLSMLRLVENALLKLDALDNPDSI